MCVGDEREYNTPVRSFGAVLYQFGVNSLHVYLKCLSQLLDRDEKFNIQITIIA